MDNLTIDEQDHGYYNELIEDYLEKLDQLVQKHSKFEMDECHANLETCK